MPAYQIPLPQYRAFVINQAIAVRHRLPRAMCTLMSMTAPACPADRTDEAAERQWLAQVARHAAAFDELLKAMRNLNEVLGRTVAGRVQ